MTTDGPPGDTDGTPDEPVDDQDDWSEWLSDDPGSPWDASASNLVFDEPDPTPTAPLPIHPDDRLWRHPSEIKYDTAENQQVAGDVNILPRQIDVAVANVEASARGHVEPGLGRCHHRQKQQQKSTKVHN